MIARTERDAIKVKMAPPVVGDIAVKKPSEETIVVPEIEKLLERDPYLKPHEKEIRRRYVFIKFVNVMLIFIYLVKLQIKNKPTGMVSLTSSSKDFQKWKEA